MKIDWYLIGRYNDPDNRKVLRDLHPDGGFRGKGYSKRVRKNKGLLFELRLVKNGGDGSSAFFFLLLLRKFSS